MPADAPDRLTVASLNLHAGVRRDATPFDVAAAVGSLDADVIVLQEAWLPDDGPDPLRTVAAESGYELHFAPVGWGRMRLPGDHRGRGVLGASAVRIDRLAADASTDQASASSGGCRSAPGARAAGPGIGLLEDGGRQEATALPPAPRGSIVTAVLSRVPVRHTEVVPLRKLRADHARRSLLLCTLAVGHGELLLGATHMAHLSDGSLRHFAAIRRLLAERRQPAARLLVGDMNLWGPVVERVLPGWRRAVVGRTWPAGLPVAQPDHILVGGGVVARSGRVLPPVGSDHLPVRAEVVLPVRSRG